MGDFLAERAALLVTRATQRGLDWDSVAGDVPDDPRARVAALATLLGLDPLGALKEDVPLDRLEEQGKAAREAAEQVERQRNEQVGPVPDWREGG